MKRGFIVHEEDLSKMTYEEALKKLEEIVEKMENEELSLSESLRHFETGMKITQHCRKLLAEAEFKVEQILQNGELEEFKEAEEV